MRKVMIAIAILVAVPALLAQQVFNNESIIKMLQMGFSESAVIEAINRNPGVYDTSLDSLIALKKAGATNDMVTAMMRKGTAAQATPPPPPPSPPPPPPTVLASTSVAIKPRVFLEAQSHGNLWNATRDQSMEMSKRF